MNRKVTLVVGGTSGLGVELALQLSAQREVWVAGRSNPEQSTLNFLAIDLAAPTLSSDLDDVLEFLPSIELLVYAAGFYQEGGLEVLADNDIRSMLQVGLEAPALLLQRIFKRQGVLNALMVITSTSQWTPRPLESVYTAVKAGLGMLANSVALGERIGKVLVVAPAGMQTPFWQHTTKDQSGMLDPAWVAEQALGLLQGNFVYRFAHILRNPARVKVVEERM